jgi:Fur family iron response transcriptional regulator
MTDVHYSGGTLTRDDLARVLENEGLKPTHQRLRVAEILMSAPCHLTADQILAELRKDGGWVSKATVYNTLKVLAERGLVKQIHLDPTRSVYDSRSTAHHHFHDVDSGQLIDIRAEEIEFSRFPSLPDGMEADGVEVVIRIKRRNVAAA